MKAGVPLDVETVVRRMIGTELRHIAGLSREPLVYDAFLAGRSLVRVRGTAVVSDAEVPWSFIEKCTEGPSVASAYLYDNGRREFNAYRSGLLDDLAPGLAAPHLFAAEAGEDGRLTVWIEDLGAGARNPRSADEILLAARHLGRLSGRWLGRVPEHAWLFRGWIDRHSQPEAVADGLAAVKAAGADRTVRASLLGRIDEGVRLIQAQDEYASALRQLPQTLCHHDAVAANVFARQADRGLETVLIDWESIGPGPVGADLASLLFASPRRGDFSARLLPEILPRALLAYSAGLADMEAIVDPDEIRLGLHASIALRWTLVRDVARILGGTGRAIRGSAPHESAEEALAEMVALVPVLLESAAEARGLMAAS